MQVNKDPSNYTDNNKISIQAVWSKFTAVVPNFQDAVYPPHITYTPKPLILPLR